MYAGTKVNWHEIINTAVAETVDESLPLFLCAFSSEMGPEEVKTITASNFVEMYGEPIFSKHGQPLLQTYHILQSGGRVLGKRLVASNATLSNLVITANVTSETVNKVDASGNPLYLDANGNETTTVTDTRATYNKAVIKYESYNKANCKTMDELITFAASLKTDSKFPLFITGENGRGKSSKAVRIVPDYTSSRKSSYMIYRYEVYRGVSRLEYSKFIIKPISLLTSTTEVSQNLDLRNTKFNQVNLKIDGTYWDDFLNKICTITGYSLDDLYSLDVLFAKSLKEKSLESISIDSESIDINSTYGLGLVSDANANGDFGDYPVVNGQCGTAWATEAVKFFNGTFDDQIYDLDMNKIDFCLDANYPFTPEVASTDVKSAVANLATFREDFFYFRDFGTQINSITEIDERVANRSWTQSPFIGDYASSYEITDPINMGNIRVTMTYGLAPLLVKYMANSLGAPLAGQFNGFVIDGAIANTLNIVPRITPDYNYKQMLDDLGVNFVNYDSNNYLTVQSTYTSQGHYGPLKYSNNVIVTQKLIKEIRNYCPKIRFMLTGSSSANFSAYKSMIEDNVITRFKSYFSNVYLEYTADDEEIENKIFNGSIYCYYKNFAQGEVFDVFAVENSSIVSAE